MVAMWGGAAAVVWRVVRGVWGVGVVGGTGDMAHVLMHPMVVGYVVLSGLVGMAGTYYVHDAGNVKLNRIVEVGLRLCGLGMMVGSATTWVGGIVWCAVVVTRSGWWGWGWGLRRRRKRGALRVEVPGDVHMLETRDSHDQMDTPGNMTRPLNNISNDDRTPSTPTVFQVSTTRGVPPSPTDFPEAEQGRLHSLVRRGKVLNVETDRTIAIGKSKYNELFLKGYEVDFGAGTITPPSSRRRQDFR